jgi:cysteine-rich repeat protein
VNGECPVPPGKAGPSMRDLPLCGNGILDFGEICDDGNRIGGDGCNAWCSAFDAMTGTCTLAGKNSICPFGRTVVGASGSPSQSIFCDLRCIDTSADGQYVVFADMGTLLKMDLFTDQVASSVSILPASIAQSFAPICSLAILEPDSSILVRECSSQRFSLLTADGGASTLVANFGDVFLPLFAKDSKATYYDKKARKAVIAGVPRGSTDWCIHLYSIDIPTQANFSSGLFGPVNGAAMPILASVPCIAYNVIEGATIYPSFSVQGMQPKSVSLEPCMQMHMPNSMCYVVYMERNDMQFLRAYIPENGGIDIAFSSSTNVMNNALGHPMVKYGTNNMIYTSLGTCFQAKSNVRTMEGKIPPTFTLGNACKLAPTSGLDCATPLNNPFMTEIMTSPYLLAEGLSVSHTHGELSNIFSGRCLQSSFNNGMVNTSGPMLYKSILQSTYANTTPIDFVELPGNMDIVYITSTSVGLISTKRFTLYDRNNPGYCRATNLIYCPQGFFGTVASGTCSPCTNKTSAGYGTSVAWQIKCSASGSPSGRRSLLSSTEDAPYEKFSSVVTRDINEVNLATSLCSYLTSKGLTCPSVGSTAMTPLQQYNMAADAADSGSVQTQGFGATLIQCLISVAETKLGRSLFRSNGAEYSTTWVSAGTNLLLASSSPAQATSTPPTPLSVNDSTNNAAVLSHQDYLVILNTCKNSRGLLGGWLGCSVPYVVGTNATYNNVQNALLGRRRLLQTGGGGSIQRADSSIVEHQGLSMASATSITWSNANVNPPPSSVIAPNTNNVKSSESEFPVWLGVLIGVIGLGIVVVLIFLFYRKQNKRKSR